MSVYDSGEPTTPDTHDEERARIAQETRDKAEADYHYQNRCIYGEKVFFVEDTVGRLPGHIYSHDGVTEHRMSGCCEYHFDEMFAQEEE